MVHFDQISDAVRMKIVKGALPLIARHDVRTLGAPSQPLALGPSLQEELLTLQEVDLGVGTAPRSTGQTLSLLQIPGEHARLGAGVGGPQRSFGHVIAGPPSGTSLSTAKPEDWSVKAVSASDLSTRIQAAIEWIDANVAGDPVIRVLSVPAYQITALTLYAGDAIVGVVALPAQGDSSFDRLRVYSMAEFIDRLRQLPRAEGLAIP